jgi:hypothetical protein
MTFSVEAIEQPAQSQGQEGGLAPLLREARTLFLQSITSI